MPADLEERQRGPIHRIVAAQPKRDTTDIGLVDEPRRIELEGDRPAMLEVEGVEAAHDVEHDEDAAFDAAIAREGGKVDAARLTEVMLLGVVSLRAGTKLHYDGANMRVTNNDAANDFLKRDYRQGWSLT